MRVRQGVLTLAQWLVSLMVRRKLRKVTRGWRTIKRLAPRLRALYLYAVRW